MTSLNTVIGWARQWRGVRLGAWPRAWSWNALELGLIALWAAWVAAPYLNTSPTLWPAGSGMGIKLLGHYFWPALQQCGACALWNGTLNGGRPALADVFGSQFHPLVMVTTLVWGVMGGAKLALVACLALAGVAQWWLARLLKLHRLAGLWTAGLAVAGGHLATQNDEGNFGLILATVSCSLVIPAVLAVALHRRRRDTLLLAALGALALVAGQGYMQFTLLAWAPALLFWVRPDGRPAFWREVLLAVGLAVLLAGVVVVPTLHFWPNFSKEGVGIDFGFSQPLEYIPLNLVIRDYAYFLSGGVLGRQPATTLQFIGWAPVLLALLTVRFIRRENAGPLLFLASGAFLSMFVGSAVPLRWLARWVPALLSLRFTGHMPGLMVAPVLALAAFGLDQLLRRDWPRVELALVGGARAAARLDLRWLMAPVLLVALAQGFGFARQFIKTREMQPLYAVMPALATDRVQWVTPPWGATDWVEPALAAGQKVTNILYSGAGWNGRVVPPAYLQVLAEAPADGTPVGALADVPVYAFAANEYAYVQLPDGTQVPCAAQGRDGDLTVACETAQAGELVVRENTFSGWVARRDGGGQALALHAGPWLAVEAPAGAHVYTFRYRPVDVAVGALLSVAGVVGMVVAGRRRGF
jgi:hypothetical protein